MSFNRARILTVCIVAATGMLLGACDPIRSIQDSVEVRHGGSVSEKLEIATAVVNEQSLGKIRAEARRRLPGASEEELHRLSLVVTRTAISGKRPAIRIMVIVALREPSPEIGSKVLQTCVQLVDEAVNGDAAWLSGKR